MPRHFLKPLLQEAFYLSVLIGIRFAFSILDFIIIFFRTLLNFYYSLSDFAGSILGVTDTLIGIAGSLLLIYYMLLGFAGLIIGFEGFLLGFCYSLLLFYLTLL